MSAERLRPQAERTLRWAAAGAVKRNERVQQERHVVARYIEIALVNIGDMGQGIKVLNLRAVWSMNH